MARRPQISAAAAPLAVDYRPVADLVPYARNARTHSEAQVAQIAASIREFGWTNPVLVDARGNIIAGHGRILAARTLGMDTVPVIVLAHLSDTQRRALVLADNKLALNAGWDEDLLRVELQALVDGGFDLALTGFSADDMALLSADPDDAGGGGAGGGAGSLADRFGVPPFTVLSARDGWWQDRKRSWLALGIQSELGRGAAPGGSPQPLDRAKGAGLGRGV